MENKELSVILETVRTVSESQRAMMEQNNKQAKTLKQIVIAVIIAFTLIVGSICGTILYIWYNSEIVVEETTTTTVDQDTGDSGDIINGNQFNAQKQDFKGGVSDGKTENNKEEN